jgi:4-hydroxy-3-polyprenylbenzoate decarboxylase
MHPVYDDRTTGMHWQLLKVGARHAALHETGTRMPRDFPRRRSVPFSPPPRRCPMVSTNSSSPVISAKTVELVMRTTSEVPANADFVIRAGVDSTEPLRDEGLPETTPAITRCPSRIRLLHITAITHRKDAVYPATIAGMPPMEDFTSAARP